jgi:AraC-like DNA-binding protein
MLSETVSDQVLRFVQQCQVAVGVCAEEDYVAQVSTLWSCLAAFPHEADETDLVVAATAVCRIATGFFLFAADRKAPRHVRKKTKPSRAHVNTLLRLTQQHHARTDLTFGGLARQLDLSAAYLSRALASETGHPFRTHLNGIRLLSAIVRLQAGSLRLAAVATEVGYTRTGELDRQFKRWFQLTPRHFRRLLRRVPPDRFDV